MNFFFTFHHSHDKHRRTLRHSLIGSYLKKNDPRTVIDFPIIALEEVFTNVYQVQILN